MAKKKPESDPEIAEAASDSAVPEPEVEDAPDPLRPVRVRNHGNVDWLGSDFKAVGKGYIPGGGEGVVTAKKADQLIADYGPEGEKSGQMEDGTPLVRGPFEIVGNF